MTTFATLQEIVHSLGARGQSTALIEFQKEAMRHCSFAELADKSRSLAQGLIKAGMSPGSRVLLFAPNQIEWIIACLALISLRATPVPLDIQMGRDELQLIIDATEACWACTSAPLARRLEEIGKPLNYVLLDSETEGKNNWRSYLSDSMAALPSASPQDIAVLFYTSGTSGRPKGVPLTHKNLSSDLNALLGARIIRPDDRLLLPLPLHHVYPFTVGMLAPLAAGIPIILPGALTGKEFLRALQQGKVTAVIGVPRLYDAIFKAIDSSFQERGRVASLLFQVMLAACVGLRKRGLRTGKYLFAPLRRRVAPHLRVLASGGSAMDPELAWKLEALGWQVGSGYGLTETSPILTVNTPGEERIGSAGRPIAGVEIHIAEPQEGRQSGEVLARGPNVFCGYWRMPEESAAAFTPEGFFRTGDLGYVDNDGYLHLIGRVSSMIVLSHGENIQPEKIEAALEQSPYVREVAVLSRNDRLAALVVPEPEAGRQAEPVEDLVRQELRRISSTLPSHHRVADYALTEEPLPRTRIGKIRRHLLMERFERAKSGKEKQATAGTVTIEQLPLEVQALLEHPAAQAIWDWLPGRFPDARIAPGTNLQLELGVDSLDWLNLTLEIRALTGAELDESAVARIESVHDLLREATTAARGGPAAVRHDPLEQLQRPTELLNPQQRRWLEPQPSLIRALGSCLLAGNRVFMRVLFRLSIRGQENLPQHGSFILTPNHVSYLDPLAVAAALPRREVIRTYWGGWTAIMFANPWMRFVSRALRVIPVDPKGGPLSSVAFAVAALQQNYNLIWFPEGARSADGRLKRFRPGIGLVTAAKPVTLVPVWLEGTYKALPVGGWLPRLCKITVTFGAPVDPKELHLGAGREHLHQAVADALQERVARIAPTSK